MFWPFHNAGSFHANHEIFFQKKGRQAGFTVFIYLDDSLIQYQTTSRLGKALEIALRDLGVSGVQVNHKTSILAHTQKVTYLWFLLEFGEGFLKSPPERMNAIQKNGKVGYSQKVVMQKDGRHFGVSQIGSPLSPLASMFHRLTEKVSDSHSVVEWDATLSVPSSVFDQVLTLKVLLWSWPVRPF